MVKAKDISTSTGSAGRRSMPMPGTSGSRLILSVFPMTQSQDLMHEGIKRYTLDAAERNSYVTLLVEDTYAVCRNLHADGVEFYSAPVPASVVAQNLVKSWSTGLIGTTDDLGPGILVCKDLDVTDAEITTANGRQAEYFRFLINEADAKQLQGKANEITDIHRLAANWMGAHDRAWYKPIEHVEMVQCAACGEEIRSSAKICRWCHTHIGEFIAKEAAKTAVAKKV